MVLPFSLFTWTTFTVTTADPAVFTATNHGLHEDDEIILETSDTLPTGLTEYTATYYVSARGMTSSTFQVSASKGGDPVATTADGSGTHKFLRRNPGRLNPLIEDNR